MTRNLFAAFLALTLCAPSIFAQDIDERLFKAGTIALTIQSNIHTVLPTGSMEPILGHNSLLLVKMEPWESLKPGDIILFEKGNSLIVHGIWARSSGGTVLVAKGYANSTVDSGYVTKEQYRGLVVGIIRRDIVEKVLTEAGK